MTDSARTEEIRARVEKAMDMVHALCQPRGSNGSREWIMSIPARPDHDPDIVIGSSLRDIPTLLTELTALREEVDRLKGALKLIKDRFDSADKAAGNEAFDERRSGLAWAMWTDAKAALSPSPAQEESVPKQD